MPRENRKRGKKHKKTAPEEPEPTQTSHDPYVAPSNSEGGQPSWIVAAPAHEEVNLEAPFGYVDAEVKTYFRNVDEQMKSWQDVTNQDADTSEGTDPNEDRRMFFMAALSEMSEKEKMLATDPDCSIILERMIYSMDDFTRRVFLDRLSGSYEVLMKHRFASHVCQTLFAAVAETVSRETRGVLPSLPDDASEGDLRTASQLILDICEEIEPAFTSLIMDPFASHVLRSILLLLSPSEANVSQHSSVRSKKSAAWKAKQGPLKSMFSSDETTQTSSSVNLVPPTFGATSRRFVELAKQTMDANEIRALAANKVASPVLQILLVTEAELKMSDEAQSLMDQVLVGIIAACKSGSQQELEASDYLNTLLRDPTSSHLLETLVSRSPDLAFEVVWRLYFSGKLTRLSIHPVANFVVSRALERLQTLQLVEACQELSNTWLRIIRASRSGVLRAAIQRASTLQEGCKEVLEAAFSAFELVSEDDQKLLVPCAVCLLPLPDYQEARQKHMDPPKPSHTHRKVDDPLAPSVQGALLLQSMLHLPHPHNQVVIDSISAMSVEEKIALAHHPAGSRVFDALIESPVVPFKEKRRFVLSFIQHYHQLVDDRIGSRVGDRCWGFADTYLKEKIARSLIPFESALAASYYGKFFARNLNLYLLQRKPDDWRAMQSQRRQDTLTQTSAPVPTKPHTDTPSSTQQPRNEDHNSPGPSKSRNKKGKRSRNTDEIDDLFDSHLGKRIRHSTLQDGAESANNTATKRSTDPSLSNVLEAIESAPSVKNRHKHKKH